MMTHRTTRRPRAQTGAALVTSLMILFVLTLVGVSAMQGTTLEEKMAGNLRNTDIAFQAAESCLTTAFASPNSFSLNTSDGPSGTIGSGHAIGSFKVTNAFNSFTNPLRGSGYSALRFRQAHIVARCRGRQGPDPDATNTARVDLVQGISQVIPKGL